MGAKDAGPILNTEDAATTASPENGEHGRDWVSIVAKLSVPVSLVLTPIIVGFIGHWYTAAIKEGDRGVEIMKLVPQLLQQDLPGVRIWAAEVMGKYSRVPIDKKTRNEIRRNALSFGSPASQKEFDRLNQALWEVRFAAEQVGWQFDATIADLKRRQAASRGASNSDKPAAPVQPAIPLSYDPPSGVAEVSATKNRLLSWEMVTEYILTLAALNAGADTKTALTYASRLFTVIEKLAANNGSALPGGAAFAAAMRSIDIAGMRRDVDKFNKGLTMMAPIMRRTLVSFKQDLGDHYILIATLGSVDYRRTDREKNLTARERRAQQQTIKAMVAQFKTVLDTYRTLVNRLDQSLEAVRKAGDRRFLTTADGLFDVAVDLRRHWAAYQYLGGAPFR